MAVRKALADPIRLQYFFLKEKNRDRDIETISRVIFELMRNTANGVVPKMLLNSVLRNFIKINKDELGKPKNDLARLGLIVPEAIFDNRTLAVKEGLMHISGKSSSWFFTKYAYEVVSENLDTSSRGKVIAKSYASTTLMQEWLQGLNAYSREAIEYRVAIGVLKSIILRKLKHTETGMYYQALITLLNLCEDSAEDVIKRTLKPLEIMTDGEIISVEENKILLGDLSKYIFIREKVSLSSYFKAITLAYISYLQEKGLYNSLIKEKLASWPVPLVEVIRRVQNSSIRTLSFEEHIKYCKRISSMYEGFSYIYQPIARGKDKHLITIKSSLISKFLKSNE